MAEKAKLIFLDVDGTLVNYRSQLPSSAVRAVKKTQESGNRVYLCTGRCLPEMPDEIMAVGPDGLIGGSGSYIADGDEVLLDEVIAEEELAAILQFLDARGLAYYLEANSGLYASAGFEQAALPAVRAYGDEPDRSVREAYPHMLFDAELRRGDIKKIDYLLRSAQDAEAVMLAFPGCRHGTWGGRGEHPLFGEIGVPGLNKGSAVKLVQAHTGTAKEDTYAFGDADADVPMFRACGTGIAMGGAGGETKRAADMVAGDVDDDGLWRAFMKLGLL